MAKEKERVAAAEQAGSVNAEKLKALQATLDKIEKDFGKGTIMKLGDQPKFDVSIIPTGSIALDHALGIGGYPRGRVIEIYGPESSGKTTLAIHAIAEAQKAGGIAAIIDAEHAFDRTYAKKLGVNVDTLLISQPDNGEQALEIADNDAVHNCQLAGFGNISVDLIYGLPRMTADDWRRQLDTVAGLGVQHLSAYHLSYEEGTAFGLKLKRGQLAEVSEDESLEQFEILTAWAQTADFEHYEISNFARPGFHSRHNSSYWDRTIYLGIGPAAHSYNRTTRSWNTANTAEYIKGIEAGSCVSETETLSPTDIFNDYVITALRTSAGIDMDYLQREQPRPMVEYLRRQAESFVRDGRLEYAANHLKLTHSGIFVSDEIMEALIVSGL